VIHGIARVEEGGAVPLLRRITHGQFPPRGTTGPRDSSPASRLGSFRVTAPGVLPTETSP
jgi:hypothetical protein